MAPLLLAYLTLLVHHHRNQSNLSPPISAVAANDDDFDINELIDAETQHMVAADNLQRCGNAWFGVRGTRSHKQISPRHQHCSLFHLPPYASAICADSNRLCGCSHRYFWILFAIAVGAIITASPYLDLASLLPI
ncbi:hypothetical protein PIB30_007762 [Stylosanthes scabra]|uniref:Uncharacterized protein n=1 Tax=Stylosanthes scabra TaxID=79078 RepID=A0ABU6Y392_9FABA|nr:hypothetical protein [Stylosanthes scabra]